MPPFEAKRLWNGAAALLLGLAILAGGAAAAGEPAGSAAPATATPGTDGARSGKRLEELERALRQGRDERERIRRKADSIAKELDRLRGEMVKAAAAVQEHEQDLSDLERQLADLDRVESEKERALDSKSRQMSLVLAALERLAYRPSLALLAQPSPPADTVRGAILLRDVLPTLKRSAGELRADLDSLARLRHDITHQKARVAAAAERLDVQHRHLSSLFARKAVLQKQTESEGAEAEKRMVAMAAEANSLRDLLARIEAERQRRQRELAERKARDRAAHAKEKRAGEDEARKEGSAKDFPRAEGDMPMPARGHVVVRYGQPNAQGTPAKGLTIATRPGAQVVAPFGGQVVFAGPFRGYGLLLIIEHSEGYHTLLAGMARIDSLLGQHLLAGEPVGVMGNGGKPLLYLELRRNGQPINPLPWLTARKTKVTG